MSMPLSRVARRLAPSVRHAGARLGDALDGLLSGARAGDAGAALRLGLVDPALGRRFLEQQAALSAVLGPEATRAVGELVRVVARADALAARGLISTLGEQCARVPAADRPRFWAALHGVAAERPAAVGLVARSLPPLLPRFDDAALARFLAEGLTLFDRSASVAEGFLRLDGQRAQGMAAGLRPGLALSEVQRTLSLYAAAHCGADVSVRAAPAARAGATDGRSVLLPEHVDHFGDERDFLLYRVWTARAAGFLEFGTLEVDLAALPAPTPAGWPAPRAGEVELERFLRALPNPSLARDLFLLIEGARVEASVREAYPGVGRDMDQLGALWRPARPPLLGLAPAEQAVELLHRRLRGLPTEGAPDPRASAAAAAAWEAAAPLPGPGAGVDDSLRAVLRAYPHLDALLRRVDPEQLQPPRPGRGSGDGRRDPEAGAPRGGAPPAAAGGQAEAQRGYQPMSADPTAAGLELSGLAPELRADEGAARRLLERLSQRAPEATLREARALVRDGARFDEVEAQLERQQAPAGPLREPEAPAAALPEDGRGASAAGGAPDTDSEALPDEHRYPEWDHGQQDHKPAWVRLRERKVLPGDRAFLDAFDAQHGALVGRVRRAFEGLRPAALRPERGLLDGEDLDLDRVVAERLDRRAGQGAEGRVYQRRRPRDREVAVAFLVDLSSSTNEVVNAAGKRIIEVEKEALLLTVEAVSAVGDACAVWGFSGYGRDQVAFYEAKAFDEPWDDVQRRRVARLGWKMENRDGAAIRHATARLVRQPARTRLLLLLSDGRPLDCGCDQYRDRYAQEDTRAALLEARRQGVHPFCITVDPSGPQYLSRVYGEGGYLVIDRVEQLPEKLTTAWRRLRG
ncbi:MAG: hypothetical protein JNM72_21635 [Deltaproteobacteria bacterium]|nr:hypothetical protein [Deltaproteobacteria bacterium]